MFDINRVSFDSIDPCSKRHLPFFSGLGLDRYYFETNTPKDIANHVMSLYSAKCLSQTKYVSEIYYRSSGYEVCD
jgi:hypothetical protein